MKELLDFLKSNPRNTWNRTVRKKQEWKSWVFDQLPRITNLNEKLYLLANNLSCPPTCAVINCNNLVKWINNSHYGETCSHKCSQELRKQNGKLKEIQSKIIATNLEKYGVENPAQSTEIQNKRLNTMIDRYGAKVSDLSKEKTKARAQDLNHKARQTVLEKYGVENISQLPNVKEKRIKTLLTKYGVSNPSAIPEIKDKKHKERQDRWQETLSNITILEETVPDKLRETHPNANIRVKFSCNVCGSTEELPSETLKYRHREFGNSCARCCQITPNSSQAENSITNFISQMNINVIRNTKDIIPPKEIDIWLPDYKLGIEYCGLYWHSESRNKDKNYHNFKLEQCRNFGYRLITIFEDEWLQRPEIVKSRLRNLLGVGITRIGARNCKIVEITNKIARDFCNNNHIQGAGKSSYSLGLYLNNKLVSVMSFSGLSPAKGSKPKKDHWELSRFCSLINHNITGGASRLFKHFIKYKSPQQVISYSDNRWNTGDLYQKLGFDYAGLTPLNYWYIDYTNICRIHRYALRKNKNDKIELTEWENRQLQGWDRIWDCGNTKWIWSKL